MTQYAFFGVFLQALLSSVLLAYSPSVAQKSIDEVYVRLSPGEKTIEGVFREIEENTSFVFTYRKRDIPNGQYLAVDAEKSLANILRELAYQHNLRFKRVNGNISVQKADLKDAPKQSLITEEITMQVRISGKVISAEDNEPLPGVSILIKGTTTGTTTDIDGNYSLSAPEGSVLQYSYIGFQVQEITVGAQTTLDISLEPDMEQLEEVVVVGYGTQQKVNLTGAVGVADSERLENRPIANVGEGLQGVIPNLNVTVRNGDPSEGIDFNVRGFESINGGAPLILVDNVPMDINRINPNDIKSVSVLKDASAAAVYGARAAFGVILIETKSGASGKVNVSLNTQWSMAKPIFNMDPVTDPHQFVLARNMANIRTQGVPTYDQDMIDGTRAWSEDPENAPAWGVVDGNLRFYGFNNYQESIMTDFAPTHQHDVTISGGTENANYYVSLGHFSKDGYLRENNTKFRRYNILMKGDFKVNDWLRLDQKVMLNVQTNDEPAFYNWDVNINSLARVPPIMPIQFPDLPFYQTPGDREQYEQYIGMYFGGTNFFPYLLDGGRETFNRYDTWMTTGATITPFEGFEIKTDFSYNIFQNNWQNVQSKIDIVSTDLNEANPISNGFSGDDFIENEVNHNQYYVFNLYGKYDFNKIPGHNISVMVGFNQEWGQRKRVFTRARQLITPQITDISATTGLQQTFGGNDHTALRGAFYRFSYNYKDRYLFEANGRYDGTSRFPQDSRFVFNPSFSVGWRLSNESFMAWSNDFVENLKIRASYGTLGNQLLGNNFYPYIPTMSAGLSPYMLAGAQIPFVRAAGLVSPTLTWETVESRNIGLDFTLFNGRLDASFDLFTRDTRDMLMRVEYPALLGTGAPQENAASLRTSGWELALTWKNRPNKDWGYDVTLALSDWTAEITEFMNPSGALLVNGSGGLNNYYEGQRIGEIWGYETVGIFQSDDEVANSPNQSFVGANWRAGDIRYADLNEDGVINTGSNTLADPGDRTIIGNSEPRWTFGINSGVSYKNFRLTTFFQGYLQRDHWPTSGNWTWFFPFNAGHVENYFITDSWSEDNRDAYFAAPHIGTNDKKNIQVQSRFLQNAAYIRLKNLMLSYDLPTTLVNKAGFGQAQIYFTGMNLWEYSPIRPPLDPETIFAGAIEFPMQRIYSLGARVSF